MPDISTALPATRTNDPFSNLIKVKEGNLTASFAHSGAIVDDLETSLPSATKYLAHEDDDQDIRVRQLLPP